MSTLGGKKLTGSAGGGAGVTGLTTANAGDAIADNEIIRGDGTNGIQGSDITIADAAATVVAVAPTSGNTIRITGGSASGGTLDLRSTSHATKGYIAIDGFTAGIGANANNELFLYSNGVRVLEMYQATIPMCRSDGQWAVASGAQVGGDAVPDVGFARAAAGDARVSNGSSGIGDLYHGVPVEANTAGSGAPNALAATESGAALTNEGTTAANYHTLPTSAAGYRYTFVVQDADGMRIVANTGDTIRVIDKVTAAAGYIESTTIGSVVTLLAINATEWVATSIHGVWTDGTWTYSDVGNTSP